MYITEIAEECKVNEAEKVHKECAKMQIDTSSC